MVNKFNSMAANMADGDLIYCRDTVPQLGSIGKDCMAKADDIFNRLEKSAGKIAAVNADADLSREGKTRKNREALEAAISQARASENEMGKTIDDYCTEQERLSAISTPSFPTIADREAVLANKRSDIKMVWDAATDTNLDGAMLDTLKEAVQAGDDSTVYLLMGSPAFAQKYTSTRRGGDMAYKIFQSQANTIIEPILSNTARTARQALAREQSGQPGSLRWLQAVVEMYIRHRSDELKRQVY